LLLKVGVHKSFTDVNAAEALRVALMVGGVSVPDVVSNDGALASAVLLNAPDSVRLVTFEIVEEVALEDGIILE
jgi:hypothetical protein